MKNESFFQNYQNYRISQSINKRILSLYHRGHLVPHFPPFFFRLRLLFTFDLFWDNLRLFSHWSRSSLHFINSWVYSSSSWSFSALGMLFHSASTICDLDGLPYSSRSLLSLNFQHTFGGRLGAAEIFLF